MNMLQKKKSKCETLQREWDNKEVTPAFNFIKKIKGLDASWKLLLMELANDQGLNGKVTWAQSSYADKLGLSRQNINCSFQKLIELGILVKVDSGKRHYRLVYNNIKKLKKSKGKKANLKSGSNKTVQPTGQPTVQPALHELSSPLDTNCPAHLTHNNINNSNKLLIEEKEDDLSSSSFPSPNKTLSDEQKVEALINDLNI